MDEKDFEEILNSRKFEDPSSDLAQRIIDASLLPREKPRFDILDWFEDFLNEVNLPKPIYAVMPFSLVIVLLIGLFIGFSNPVEKRISKQEQIHLQDFLYVKGELP